MQHEALVRKIIAEQLGVHAHEVLGPKELASHLDADSLDKIEIVMALEDEFDIVITDEQTDALRTVYDIIELVGSLTKE